MLLTMGAVIVGLGIIAYGSGDAEGTSLLGDVLALGVSAFFAAALTAARCVKHISMVPGVAMGYGGAALLLLPFADPLSVPPAQTGLVLLYGLFILGSSILLAIGPRYIKSAEVGLLVLLESALAPLLAWAVIGETVRPLTLIGGGVVIGALFVYNFVALVRFKNPHSRPVG
ncbi:MAG: EamA family transporter [Roseobacter sp.]